MTNFLFILVSFKKFHHKKASFEKVREMKTSKSFAATSSNQTFITSMKH